MVVAEDLEGFQLLEEARKVLYSERAAAEMKFGDVGTSVRVNPIIEFISSPELGPSYDPQGR